MEKANEFEYWPKIELALINAWLTYSFLLLIVFLIIKWFWIDHNIVILEILLNHEVT